MVELAATRDPRFGLRTFSGQSVWPLDQDPGDIDLQDIAHALSLLCRFNGHVTRFYSVAQHSVLVSLAVPAELGLWALLHDASEAYLCDVPRPVKLLPEFQPYRDAEANLQGVINERFGLVGAMPAEVEVADNLLLAAEIRDLMPGLVDDHWRRRAGAWPLVVPIGPERAEAQFLARYADLCKAPTGI